MAFDFCIHALAKIKRALLSLISNFVSTSCAECCTWQAPSQECNVG